MRDFRRPFRRGDVYAALGLKGQIIPPDMEGTFTVDVRPEHPDWYRDYHGVMIVKRASGAYAKHRIFIPCGCGRLIPFGRMHQHRCK